MWVRCVHSVKFNGENNNDFSIATILRIKNHCVYFSLQKFLDNGMMMRLKDTRFLVESVKNKAYQPVHVVNVVPILSILCMGIILSAVILITENIYYRYKKEKREKRRRYLKAFYPSRNRPFIMKW